MGLFAFVLIHNIAYTTILSLSLSMRYCLLLCLKFKEIRCIIPKNPFIYVIFLKGALFVTLSKV